MTIPTDPTGDPMDPTDMSGELTIDDGVAWLEDLTTDDAGNVAEARVVLAALEAATSRENTVLGMLMARRPHEEIRDYLLTGVITEPTL